MSVLYAGDGWANRQISLKQLKRTKFVSCLHKVGKRTYKKIEEQKCNQKFYLNYYNNQKYVVLWVCGFML